MKDKMVQATITVLIAAFIGSSVLMIAIAPINEAEAWLRHACNCTEIHEFTTPPPKWSSLIECDVTYHWNPLSHDFSCS